MNINEAEDKVHGCCSGQAGIQILPDFQTQQESAGAYCGDHDNDIEDPFVFSYVAYQNLSH